jgi:hypothetical protein
MFVGHYAAALAAKAAQPKAPLWTYVLAAQLVDVGWSVLIITGAERLRFDPSLPGSSLVLDHMPYTHSLPAAVLWAVAAGLLATWALKLPRGAGIAVGLTVLSHWGLDFLVHRPDLALWFGGPKVGLAWWDHPVPEQALEMGLLAMGAAAWGWRRGQQGLNGWAAPLFVALLLGAQIAAMLTPPASDPVQMGISALAVYLAVTLIAWAMDLGERRAR